MKDYLEDNIRMQLIKGGRLTNKVESRIVG